MSSLEAGDAFFTLRGHQNGVNGYQSPELGSGTHWSVDETNFCFRIRLRYNFGYGYAFCSILYPRIHNLRSEIISLKYERLTPSSFEIRAINVMMDDSDIGGICLCCCGS